MTAAKFKNRPRKRISAITWFIGKVDKIGVRCPIPAAEDLLTTAQWTTTGERDVDPNLLDRLSRFLECFAGEERLTFTGRLLIRGIERDALQRSGTTFSQNLLSQHPGCRWIRSWEIGLENWPDRGVWGAIIPATKTKKKRSKNRESGIAILTKSMPSTVRRNAGNF